MVGIHIGSVAAGCGFNAAISATGMVYTLGISQYGRLSHGDEEESLVPKQFAGRAPIALICRRVWPLLSLPPSRPGPLARLRRGSGWAAHRRATKARYSRDEPGRRRRSCGTATSSGGSCESSRQTARSWPASPTNSSRRGRRRRASSGRRPHPLYHGGACL